LSCEHVTVLCSHHVSDRKAPCLRCHRLRHHPLLRPLLPPVDRLWSRRHPYCLTAPPHCHPPLVPRTIDLLLPPVIAVIVPQQPSPHPNYHRPATIASTSVALHHHHRIAPPAPSVGSATVDRPAHGWGQAGPVRKGLCGCVVALKTFQV
jgi:hypothetical protein